MTSRKLFVPLLALTFAACGDDETTDENPSAAEAVPANADDALETYADIALATYTDSLAEAEAMDEALRALVEAPSEQALVDAQQAWLSARVPYLQTEVYRFYGGPIDNENGPEGLLNAWPMDENYVDYVEDDADAGIINDPSVEISAESLADLNEQGGDKNIATGYHAIEFLLWGQDFNDDGPGDRPYTDYVVGEEGTAANQERRGQYLLAVSELLMENLQQLVDAWSEGSADNYRARFLDMDPGMALGLVTSGASILAGFETGGERLQAALDAQEQEEEHSCFSDNTHNDMIYDIVGVQNVWVGSYDGLTASTTVNGTGLRDVFAEGDPAVASSITQLVEQSLTLARGMQVPFDQEIVGSNSLGNQRVQDVVDSLQDLQGALEDDAIPLFGLTKLNPPE